MQYSESTKRKIQLYFAANFLYDRQFSYPQVVEELSEFEEDSRLVTSIAAQAMKDEWRKVFNEVQKMVADGRNFEEIFRVASTMEEDPEVAYFICRKWHDVQSLYADSVIESSTNIAEGLEGVIYCSLALAFLFLIGGSLVVKIIMIIILLVSIVMWVYGRKQRKMAQELKKILEEDYTRFDKLI